MDAKKKGESEQFLRWWPRSLRPGEFRQKRSAGVPMRYNPWHYPYPKGAYNEVFKMGGPGFSEETVHKFTRDYRARRYAEEAAEDAARVANTASRELAFCMGRAEGENSAVSILISDLIRMILENGSDYNGVFEIDD
jgi:hypothetical protein